MAAHSPTAATLRGLLRLSALPASAGAAVTEVLAALAGLLLWGSSQGPAGRGAGAAGQALGEEVQHQLHTLAAMLEGSTEREVSQLAAALQRSCEEKKPRGRAAAARRAALVQGCYAALHEQAQRLAAVEGSASCEDGGPGGLPGMLKGEARTHLTRARAAMSLYLQAGPVL